MKSTQNKNSIALNNSYINKKVVKNKQFDLSKSLIRKSVITCSLKANNEELAKTLSIKEQEVTELRNENSDLMRENYDLKYMQKFRQYNYESFLNKYYQVASEVDGLFNEICKMSDSLIEMKTHPFLSEEVTEEEKSIFNEREAFKPRDKILRSPIKLDQTFKPNHIESLTENDQFIKSPIKQPQTFKSNHIDSLAEKINSVRNQSNHSVHNISVNIHPLSTSRALNKTFVDKSHHSAFLTDSLINKSVNRSIGKKLEFEPIKTPKVEGKVMGGKPLRQSTNITNSYNTGQTDLVIFSKSKSSNKPKKGSQKKTTTTRIKRKKLNLRLEPEEKPEPNKEDYLQKKKQDAYYLSFNETANVTVLPPSLNEYINKQDQQVQEQVPNASTDEPAISDKKEVTKEKQTKKSDKKPIKKKPNMRRKLLNDTMEVTEPEDDDLNQKSNIDEKRSSNVGISKKVEDVKPVVKRTKTKAPKRKATKTDNNIDKENENPALEQESKNGAPVRKQARRNVKKVDYHEYKNS